MRVHLAHTFGCVAQELAHRPRVRQRPTALQPESRGVIGGQARRAALVAHSVPSCARSIQSPVAPARRRARNQTAGPRTSGTTPDALAVPAQRHVLAPASAGGTVAFGREQRDAPARAPPHAVVDDARRSPPRAANGRRPATHRSAPDRGCRRARAPRRSTTRARTGTR